MQNAIFPHILADYNSALKINPYLAQAYYNRGQTSKERSLICGLAALFLWYVIQTRSQHFHKEVANCLQNARYLRDRLLEINYHPLLNDFSTTVVFDKPAIELCRKWQLATQGNIAHIVVMQHISTQKIDQFIDNLLVKNKLSCFSTSCL